MAGPQVTAVRLIICFYILINVTPSLSIIDRAHPQHAYNGHGLIHHTKKNLLAFAARSPPRFDKFTDKVLGKWSQVGPSSTDTTSGTVGEVEEVMRACGGAVQGIREISFGQFDSIYHNRADDGFVYFECGSYVSSPVRLTDGVSAPALVCSISSVVSHGTRTIMTSVPRSCGLFAKCGDVKYEDGRGEGISESMGTPASIKWEKETVCRMRSSDQPWMLQRAVWESFFSNGGPAEKRDGGFRVDAVDVGVLGWVAHQKAGADTNSGNLWAHNDLNSLLSNDSSLVLQMGSSCASTDESRAILCCYDTEGFLKAVVLQEGRLS